MALKCGIIGISGSGKSTLFNCISNTRAEIHHAAYTSSRSNIGTMIVPDPRLQSINHIMKAARIVPVTIEIVDIPGLSKGGSQTEGNKFLSELRNVDTIVHVLRCFDDPLLPHVEGSVDPVRDKEIVDLELQIKDLESVEKKINRLEKSSKTGDYDTKHGLSVLLLFKEHLESFQPIRTAPVHKEDYKYIEDLFLLSAKPVLYVCNVGDAAAVHGNEYSRRFLKAMEGEQAEVMLIAGKLESEITELEDPADRNAFLTDAGLTEPSVDRLVRAAYHLLDLQTFFTTGPKETHAWILKKGMTAVQAAGTIHSDMEKGFIRAEVMKYEDFARLGSEHACREAGKLMVEGKNYIVQDGDILHIRFNV
jgi:GTP-binding protein YchF